MPRRKLVGDELAMSGSFARTRWTSRRHDDPVPAAPGVRRAAARTLGRLL